MDPEHQDQYEGKRADYLKGKTHQFNVLTSMFNNKITSQLQLISYVFLLDLSFKGIL